MKIFKKGKRRLVMSGIIRKGKVETRAFKYDVSFIADAQRRQERQVAQIHADRF